jgi:hypothetical protein
MVAATSQSRRLFARRPHRRSPGGKQEAPAGRAGFRRAVNRRAATCAVRLHGQPPPAPSAGQGRLGCVKDLGQFIGLLIRRRIAVWWRSVSAWNGVR